MVKYYLRALFNVTSAVFINVYDAVAHHVNFPLMWLIMFVVGGIFVVTGYFDQAYAMVCSGIVLVFPGIAWFVSSIVLIFHRAVLQEAARLRRLDS